MLSIFFKIPPNSEGNVIWSKQENICKYKSTTQILKKSISHFFFPTHANQSNGKSFTDGITTCKIGMSS